jgi:hypothetical protein
MKFSFEVGTEERHVIEFYFDSMRGDLSIKVDGCEVVKDFRMFSLSRVKEYTLNVGTRERHVVRIEKERKLFLAGLRQQKYRVFIDNKLVREYEGF